MHEDADDFIVDVGKADLLYSRKLVEYPDVTVGSFLIPDYAHVPYELQGPLRDIVQMGLRFIDEFANIQSDRVEHIIRHSDEVRCVSNETTYWFLQYLINAETPFALRVIRESPLRDKVHLPNDIDERLEELRKIPRCL